MQILTLSALNIFGMFTLLNKRRKSRGKTNHYTAKVVENKTVFFPHRVFIRWPPFPFTHFRGIFNQTREVITYLLHSQTHITIILCDPKNKTKTENAFQIKSQLLFRLQASARLPPSSCKTDVSTYIFKRLKTIFVPRESKQ